MGEREAELDCPCPPAGAIDVVGKKWALCVVTLLGRYGPLRFGRIQHALPAVSPATLTGTLRELERFRLVRQVPVPEDHRSPGAYALTEEGEKLHNSLLPLARWLRATGSSPRAPPT